MGLLMLVVFGVGLIITWLLSWVWIDGLNKTCKQWQGDFDGLSTHFNEKLTYIEKLETLLDAMREERDLNEQIMSVCAEHFSELGEAVENYLDDLSVENLYALEVVFDDMVDYYNAGEDDAQHDSYDAEQAFNDEQRENIMAWQHSDEDEAEIGYNAHIDCEECPPECEYCKLAEQTKVSNSNGITEEI